MNKLTPRERLAKAKVKLRDVAADWVQKRSMPVSDYRDLLFVQADRKLFAAARNYVKALAFIDQGHR